MRAVYGDKGGYGWKHNQIVGAQIIVVPAYEQDAVARSGDPSSKGGDSCKAHYSCGQPIVSTWPQASNNGLLNR